MIFRRLLLLLAAILAAGFLLIQLVPYGRAHDNPPIVSEPNWDSPQTRELARRACFDCHSNATTWPWYSNVAPVSWLLQRHVEEGRHKLNFSDWSRSEGEEAEEMGESVVKGSMPLANYLWTHPAARLTDAERTALADGLNATAGLSLTTPDGAGSESDHEAEEHEENE